MGKEKEKYVGAMRYYNSGNTDGRAVRDNSLIAI